MEVDGLGLIAYDAYCRAAGGVSLVSGETLPEWDQLSQQIQHAWFMAAITVKDEVLREIRVMLKNASGVPGPAD